MASSVCSYYMRGSCRFGNRCWNSHDLGLVRTDSPFRMDEVDTSDEEIHFVIGARRETTPMTASPSSSASRPRQRNQVLPDSANKPLETTETASSASKDKWCLKNINTGETRSGSPDSVLVETVKKLNEADNLVVSLRQQLRVKNEGDNFSWIEHQMEQCLESDLQCNICYEMFIKPTVLNCSHTFCHECIESWTRRVNHCPTCRVYVKNKSYCLTLDTYLDKIADCLPDEIKTRRETLKVERNNNRVEVNRSRRNNARRRNHRNQSMRRTLGVLWGERDRDGAEWNIALEEALFDPIRLGDVIGRNRDDRDDWDDELSDSTLDSLEYFCSYCDNMGHSASNCPISIMEETGDIW
ncbi:probable E3 ubiquitin-protein ligase makorin-2 isoform X1 [Acyrthosiphon pisum]|uniref:RING-type E3 ubiquitin transferase n=1 Tax=Acyrthosiphon pisum TaxID=7029 RepID=A0A8R2B9J4_ACYPI|nr:probable E3 ubiquitin-protein ligase makorin-2 isoform X1 [Acyrthosiphon pisum]XP_008187522.1 probable E3 ubiquitin-protein ligase makorin-2 isoform X1 [Acyrthosiphon pisum]|eukprot:XP_001943872.1 PREDICTED: probable E3 ubiquitin-protein ligase makorin-2 isoform X1 [Acyrthosiphon pisum]